MKFASRLIEYFEQNKVWFVPMSHPRAYTAQEIAAVQHVPGREMAKTIILRADQDFAMIVIPATQRIDLKILKEELPYKEIAFATEYEFAWLFPDSEVGAMPPFGNLYNPACLCRPNSVRGQGDNLQCRNSCQHDSHEIQGLWSPRKTTNC